MKIFAIIKNNNLAKVVFVIVSLLVIFHQVIYHIITEKFFKKTDTYDNNDDNNDDNNGDNNDDNINNHETFINLDENNDESLYKDKDFINNLKNKHNKDVKKFKLNTNPNLDSKRCNLFLNENKFLPECCVLNYEVTRGTGCACMTPEQKYYLQYRGNNRNKDKIL